MKKKRQKWLGEELSKDLDIISAKKGKALIDLTLQDIAPDFFTNKKRKKEDEMFTIFKKR